MERAFRIAAVASAAEIAAELSRGLGLASAEALILRGVLAKLQGRTDEAVQLLRRARRAAKPMEVVYVSDLLVPLLITRNDLDGAEAELAGIEPIDDMQAPIAGLHALLEATRGDVEACERWTLAARSRLEQSDVLFAARALQRLAGASYYRNRAEQAIEDATASAERFATLGAFRSASASYSVAYITHHTITGDIEQAYAFARLSRVHAQRSGDLSFATASAVAEYAIAAEICDESAYAELQGIIRGRPLPTQCRERLARGIADALPFAWRGDFAAFRANVSILRDAIAATPSQRSLCFALLAIASAAVDDRASALRASRAAIGLASPRNTSGPAFELRYRLLARALAGAACILIGDAVRGRRAMSARSLAGRADLRAIVAAADGTSWRSAPLAVRGYARIVSSAHDLMRTLASPLTAREAEVLRLLADGFNAPQIAQSTQRSVHTIRAHTRAIIQKLDVHGRAAAVAAARRSGLL